MFLFFIKIKLYPKNILKKEDNISKESTIICLFSLSIEDSSLTGRNPPDDINVKAKFNESNVLTEKIFRIIKIESVKTEYKKKIFIVCFNISELSKEIKFVKVFLKLSS